MNVLYNLNNLENQVEELQKKINDRINLAEDIISINTKKIKSLMPLKGNYYAIKNLDDVKEMLSDDYYHSEFIGVIKYVKIMKSSLYKTKKGFYYSNGSRTKFYPTVKVHFYDENLNPVIIYDSDTHTDYKAVRLSIDHIGGIINFSSKTVHDGSGEGLYLLQMEHTDFYKIGITKNIKKRLSAIQNGNPVNIIIRYFIPTVNNKYWESKLLSNFKHFKTKGEWVKVPCNASLLREYDYIKETETRKTLI